MKKTVLAALVLACSVSMVYAAVDVNADMMAIGTIDPGTDIGGAVTAGDASVETSSDGSPFSSVLVIPEGSSLSFDGFAGDVLKISSAMPADGASAFSITSENSSDVVEGASSDGMTAYSEYSIPADGTYSLSPSGGSAYIYTIESGV